MAAAEENARWGSDKITVDIKMVGDHPGGSQEKDALIVRSAWASYTVLGQKPHLRGAQSTDANVPISMGIPALAIPGGGQSGNNHSPSEALDPTDAYMGPQITFLTILGLVGVEGASDPLLPKRK